VLPHDALAKQEQLVLQITVRPLKATDFRPAKTRRRGNDHHYLDGLGLDAGEDFPDLGEGEGVWFPQPLRSLTNIGDRVDAGSRKEKLVPDCVREQSAQVVSDLCLGSRREVGERSQPLFDCDRLDVVEGDVAPAR
jgi:hypothetical protein